MPRKVAESILLGDSSGVPHLLPKNVQVSLNKMILCTQRVLF